MEKVNIILGKKFEYLRLGNENTEIVFDSIETLEKFLSDPASILNYDDFVEDIAYSIKINEDEYYVDKDGNMLKQEEVYDNPNAKCIKLSEEELNEKIEEAILDFNAYYKRILAHDYEIDALFVQKDSAFSIDDLKKVINRLKDSINTLDVRFLTIKEIIDIITPIKINDSVKIITKYNHHDSSTNEKLLELLIYLEGIKRLIDRYELSPLEKCIFINDLIRERKYKVAEGDDWTSFNELSEEEKEKTSNSRSLLKVFESDEIVCAGFSNLYAGILDLFGINSENGIYDASDESNVGHMANIVYLNDSKYNIKGVFEVDTTWGRIYDKNDTYDYQKSINNYFFFARSLDIALKIKEKNNLKESENSSSIAYLNSRIARARKLMSLGAPLTIIGNEIKLIFEISEVINDKLGGNFLDKEIKILKGYHNDPTTIDFDTLEETIANILNKVNCFELDSEAFKSALYRVKLIEHSMDKDKYPLTENSYLESYLSRIRDEEVQLLRAIFGEVDFLDDKQELEIKRAELISVLHKIANDGVDKNPTLIYKK